MNALDEHEAQLAEVMMTGLDLAIRCNRIPPDVTASTLAFYLGTLIATAPAGSRDEVYRSVCHRIHEALADALARKAPN